MTSEITYDQARVQILTNQVAERAKEAAHRETELSLKVLQLEQTIELLNTRVAELTTPESPETVEGPPEG